MTLVQAVLVLGGAGLLFGALLAFAARQFRVETDPRVDKIKEVLPGANCGACGFPGCSGLADAIVAGSAAANACPVGGQEVNQQIAEILGITVSDSEPNVAVALCQGGPNCERTHDYRGLPDCRAALAGPGLSGGEFACEWACLGFGNCARACPFDALYMSDDGLPLVIRERCTGCGMCVDVCPRGIMAMVPVSSRVDVRCRNQDRGAVVRKQCKAGCIACKACQKICPEQAITVENNIAVIDYSKCTNCGQCADKCPTGSILDLDAATREQMAS